MARCSECDFELGVSITTREYVQVFCPNEDCPKFVKTFWIER